MSDDNVKINALFDYVDRFGQAVKPEGMVRHFEYIIMAEAYLAASEVIKNLRKELDALKAKQPSEVE